MAQTQALPNEGLYEIAGYIENDATKIICIKTSCTANADQTYAGVTKSDESGLTIASADSVATDDNVVTMEHEFTAGAGATVKGAMAVNTAGDKNLGMACWAADVVMEDGDKLDVTFTWTVTDETA